MGRVRPAEKMHRQLLLLYGTAKGRTCSECPHFERHRNWFKCGQSAKTGGTATDWRARWQACGKVRDDDSDPGPNDAAEMGQWPLGAGL
jgi:hypothetical protein